MAQRFGGKYSPGGASGASQAPGPQSGPQPRARRARAGARVNLLFIAPLPLAVTAFSQEPIGMAAQLLGLGLLMLAAWLTREGQLAHEAFDARTTARKPAMPRKLVGACLLGLGLALAGFGAGAGVLNGVIFGVLGTVLHVLAFGPDPLRDKLPSDADHFQADRVARAVEAAEDLLTQMQEAASSARDREIDAAVARFQATARAMFRTVEEDPRDLTQARKYLGVYLTGARDAAQKFSALFARTGDQSARDDFLSLLGDLDANFRLRTEKLLTDDRTDLTVEIDVLRERLARDGLTQDELTQKNKGT